MPIPSPSKDEEELEQPVITASSKWYSMKALSGNSAEIELYGEIGGWGITAKEFARDLKGLGNPSHLFVRLNSPGGSVVEGNAMYTILRNHPASVTMSIESAAYSMGSVVAMAGDHVQIADNALMMIHNPSGWQDGESKDLRKTADVMDKFKKTMLVAYARKTGLDEETLSAMMDEETWLDAAEAVELGFADEVTGALDIAAHFDLSGFRNVPERLKSSDSTDNKKEGNAMTTKTTPASDPVIDPVAQVDATAIAAEALNKDTQRRKSIREAFARHGDTYRDTMDACLDDSSVTLDVARARLLDKIGETAEPLATGSVRVETGADASDKFRAAASEALELRYGVEGAKNDGANEMRAFSLFDIARKSLENHGVSLRGMSRMQIVGAAFTHSTSDFPYLLENVLGKELQRAYGAFEETWRSIAAVSSVPDFKVNPRIRLGSFNSLDTIKEGGEYTHGTIGEEFENIQAVTKGKMISLTRQAIINDDLNGFMRIASMMGRAAARTVGNDVYDILTANAAMADGVTVFHASSHGGNLTSSGTAMSVASLSVGKKIMRLQKDPNSRDVVGVSPQTLVVPVALEDTALTLISAETDFSNANSKKPNIHRNTLKVVSDPRLDVASATAWYLIANPNEIPLLEVAFLDGNQTPYLESQQGFTIDGTQWKVRMDYGVSANDWRGGYKNVGA